MTRTKKYKLATSIFGILTFLCSFGPFIVYALKGLIESDLVHEKVGLSMTVLIVAILTVIGMVNQKVMHSRIWILLLGIYICLDEFLTPLIIIAVCQILNELVVYPLYKHFKLKKTIRMEIEHA